MFRILIAEDDSELRQLFSYVLTKHGYNVTGVDNGAEALRSLDLSYYDLIISDIMMPVIAEPRKELSKYAPKMKSLKIDPEKIKDVIGKGGKVIQKICAECEVQIDIEDDGSVFISGLDANNLNKAYHIIKTIVDDPEPGSIYKGVVTRLMN